MNAGHILFVIGTPIVTALSGYLLGRAHQILNWRRFSERLKKELEDGRRA